MKLQILMFCQYRSTSTNSPEQQGEHIYAFAEPVNEVTYNM
jgi:hypothetical protein